jgi:hypothetical protein
VPLGIIPFIHKPPFGPYKVGLQIRQIRREIAFVCLRGTLISLMTHYQKILNTLQENVIFLTQKVTARCSV